MSALTKKAFALFMAILSALQIWVGIGTGGADNSTWLTYLTYPAEVGELTASQIDALKESIGTAPTPEANAARDGLSVFVSPYFKLNINGTPVPVYATGVYVGTTDSGALHSYAVIRADFARQTTVKAALACKGFAAVTAAVLPEAQGVDCTTAFNTVSAEFTKTGTYTFLFNLCGQAHVFTLFIRDYKDEAAEISRLQAEYGTENVTVYNSGVHSVGDITFVNDNSVLYLCSGAILKAEPNGSSTNTVIGAWGKKNIKILGSGTVDMGALAWKEKCGVTFSYCEEVTAENIIFINSAHWTFITHGCDGVNVKNCAVFGYRTNSDGFNICSTHNALVENCFCRTGDDAFSVKGTGEPGTVDTKNVTFRNCYAHAGKARCFGITGEIYCDIDYVLFTDCAVIYRDAVWDNDFVSSLAVSREYGVGKVDNVVFQNIEIYYDKGRPINCIVNNPEIENTSFNGIVFSNITARAGMKSQFKDKGTGNTMDVTLENVVVNCVKVKEKNFERFFVGCNSCRIFII